MATIAGQLNGLLSGPTLLPATLAGALAAILLAILVMAWRRPRLLLPLAGLALGVLATGAVIAQLASNERAATDRALRARAAALTRASLAPGSALACLDAGAGERVQDACEKKVFASAQSTAAAVAFMAARLTLIADVARSGDASLRTALAATRRAVALDRYGVAAHVLATHDGCTAAKCPAFAWVGDPSVLQANLKAGVFDQYVSRYAADWNVIPPAAKPPAVAAAPAKPAPPVAKAPPLEGETPMAAVKPGEHWDFPSAKSIPAISIMTKEPPSKSAAPARPAASKPKPNTAQAHAAGGTALAAAIKTGKPLVLSDPPLPPKRPQEPAAEPSAQ
jgi:hypothetical protein